MIRDLFANISILISILLLIGIFFKDNTFDIKLRVRNQVVFGLIFGLLGLILMLFNIKVTDTVLIDVRNISMICAGIMGGPLASVLSALIIAIFRIMYFGINAASIAGFVTALIIGTGIAITSTLRLSTRNKFIIMFLIAMLSSNAALFYLLGGTPKFVETLLYYWPIHLLGSVLTYYTYKYIRHANTNFIITSYYRVTADSLSDLISTHKVGGEILFVSSPIKKLLGYTQEEFIGTSFYEYIHPQDIENLKKVFSISLWEHETLVQTFRIKHKLGSYLWVEASAQSILDDAGSIKEIICVTRDITKRKQIEQELEVSRTRLKAILENAGTGIVLRDYEGRLIDANPAYLEMMGCSKEELYNLENILHPEDKGKVQRLVEELKTGRCTINRSDIRYILKNNEIIYADVTSTLIPGTEHTPPSIVKIINNVTERRDMERKLRNSEERFRTAFNNAVIGMCLSYMDGRFFKVNQAFCDFIGYTAEELLNMEYRQVTHPDYLEKEILLRKQILEGEISNFILEKQYICKDGNIKWAILGVSAVYDSENKPMHYIGQVQDITIRKKAEEELKAAKMEAEKLASIDYLTGLLNRRAFESRFMVEIERSNREGTYVSLILADIDYFKKVNDTFGHNVGDIVLQQFSRTLLNSSRSYDFLGRHGGEEFVVCLPNTDSKQAAEVAERMRKTIEELTIIIGKDIDPIKITASFGVTSAILYSKDCMNSLIMQADKAMYNAKISGRNRVCVNI